jgi:hypothetical protein
MLFDIRGRRKHLIRVVYAILALLMGASLFLVVGPVNIGSLIGTGTTTEASQVLDEQAERIEGRLRREPDNETLLASLTRTRIAAGNSLTEVNSQTGGPLITPEARREFSLAAEAWDRYLKRTDSPSPSVAQLMAGTFFSLAESSSSLEEIQNSLAQAAATQRIASAGRANVGVLSTLAIYEYYAGDFAAGDRAAEKAAAGAPKGEAKQVEKQLAEFRKRGKQWQKEEQRIAKIENNQRKESLKNPFGGLSGGTGAGALGE